MQDNSMFEYPHFDSSIDEELRISDSLSNLFTGEALINDFPSIWELDATETVKKKFKNELNVTNSNKKISFEDPLEISLLKEPDWHCQNNTNISICNNGATTDENHSESESGSLNVTFKINFDVEDRVKNEWSLGESSTGTENTPIKTAPAAVKPNGYQDKRFSKRNNKGIYPFKI